jgi:hypothetical protein
MLFMFRIEIGDMDAKEFFVVCLVIVYHHVFERILCNLYHHGRHCLKKEFNPIITSFVV